MNPEVEPQHKKRKTNPPPSFSSLPNEIIVNCLARVSRSYYPILSLVCKTFRSLILSRELFMERFHLATYESVFHVCLQLSNSLAPSWFSLWIKPDRTLTNDIGRKKKSTGNTLLVPVRSSYYPRVPMLMVGVGSELYALAQGNEPPPVFWVRKKDRYAWHKAAKMTVPRERPLMGVLNGKIYVMGGCGESQSANWAEVFDPKTQTWEPLPDPGAEIRLSKIRRIEASQGKLYVRSDEKYYVYDPEQGLWNVSGKTFVMCLIKNVWYSCDQKHCLWFDTKRQEWRVVRGLSMLNKNRSGDSIEVANYFGKLLILWDKFVHQGRCQHKNIWCAVIALERRNDDDEVWGNIEWASVVLTVPSSYVFLRSQLNAL